MTQNDVMQLLIAKDVGATSPTTAAGSTIVEASDTYLLDGEIAVVNSANQVVDATTVLTDLLVEKYGIKIVQRSGDKLIFSDQIKAENVRSVIGTADAAAAEQLSYIGYNGSAGSINAANSSLYVIRLELQETDLTGFGQEMLINAPWKSSAAADQEEIALGFALVLGRALRRQTQQPAYVEAICNEAVVATNDFLADATVLRGATSFTVPETSASANDAGEYATSTPIAVGDYVRIGGIGAGTALTDGVYKVTAVSGVSGDLATITLDRPIEAPSGTYAAATSDIVVIPAASITGAEDWGLKIEGMPRAFEVGKFPYSKVSFHIGLDSVDSFADTEVTYSTAMSLGHGTYEEVAQLEWELQGNDGNVYRGDFMTTTARADADSAAAYDLVSMNYFGDHATGGVGVTPRRSKQLVIAAATGYSTTEAADNVWDILEAYLGNATLLNNVQV